MFPAIALAAHLGQTKIITDEMLMVAAEVRSPGNMLACFALPHHGSNKWLLEARPRVYHRQSLWKALFLHLQALGTLWKTGIASCIPAFIIINADHRHDVCGQALPLTIKDEDLKRGCVYPSLYDIRRAMCQG